MAVIWTDVSQSCDGCGADIENGAPSYKQPLGLGYFCEDCDLASAKQEGIDFKNRQRRTS